MRRSLCLSKGAAVTLAGSPGLARLCSGVARAHGRGGLTPAESGRTMNGGRLEWASCWVKGGES